MRRTFPIIWWGKAGIIAAALLCSLAPALAQPARSHRYSAAALFNEGNAMSRAGRTGWAVLDYERASLIAPADPAIAANLRWVRARAGLSEPEISGWRKGLGAVPADAVAWLGSLGLVMVGAALISMTVLRPQGHVLQVAAGAGAVLVLVAIGSAVATWPKMNEGVVVSRNAVARIAPATDGAAAFPLKEGEVVTLAGETGNFALVRNSTGQAGWAARNQVARVMGSGYAG